MPPPASRWASTLASTGAPAARATASSRARSPGWAAGARPTLLSPHTTRSGREAARPRLSRSLARNRASTGPTAPGWTNATLAVPAGGGAGRSDEKASAARGRAAATRTASARVAPGTPGRTAAATATLTATSRKPSSQTPPRAATASSAGAFHWLAPSRPQGPPRASQDRRASPATNALGTSTRAAASRPGPGRPRPPPSRALASQPTGAQSTARSMASGTMNTPTVENRKALTARKNPVPPSQALTAASRPPGAVMARRSTGTSPTRASHHHPGRGKARASGAPARSAPSRAPHLPWRVLNASEVWCARATRSACAGSEVHGDVLDLQVLGDALGAALAAEAGLLDPAEGGGRVRDHPLVEADHARLQALHDPEGPLEVAGVDVGAQPELGVVGRGDRRLLVVEAGHRGHRPADLLLHHPAVARPRPHDGPRPLVEGVADQLRHLVDGVLVDQRADGDALLGAPADLHGPHPLGQLVGERAGDRLGHVEAVGGRAGLADVAHLGDHRPLDGGVEIRVVEDEERRVAAELHRDAQDLVGRLGDERPPHLRRAREGELAGARVLDERLHHLARGARRDDV